MEACQFEQGKEQQVSGAQIPIGAAQADAEIAESSSKSEAERKEELEKMRRRLKEIDEEADNIRANFDKGIEEAALENEDLAAAAALAEKEEVDTRSIFVGNVDYTSTPEEVQEHFQSCGTVNRVTIMTDEFGYPKGFAFVEFVEAGAVPNALLLNETELHGRPLKVSPKRTNIPGMKQYRGRRFPRGAFMPGPPFYPSYGYGRFPRYRPPMRYSPY